MAQILEGLEDALWQDGGPQPDSPADLIIFGSGVERAGRGMDSERARLHHSRTQRPSRAWKWRIFVSW